MGHAAFLCFQERPGPCVPASRLFLGPQKEERLQTDQPCRGEGALNAPLACKSLTICHSPSHLVHLYSGYHDSARLWKNPNVIAQTALMLWGSPTLVLRAKGFVRCSVVVVPTVDIAAA